MYKQFAQTIKLMIYSRYLKSRTAPLANLDDILPQGGHVTFSAAVKPCRLISFIPRVVSTNYELAPAIIKKCNFAARAPRSSLNVLTISYPIFPEVCVEKDNKLKYSFSQLIQLTVCIYCISYSFYKLFYLNFSLLRDIH